MTPQETFRKLKSISSNNNINLALRDEVFKDFWENRFPHHITYKQWTRLSNKVSEHDLASGLNNISYEDIKNIVEKEKFRFIGKVDVVEQDDHEREGGFHFDLCYAYTNAKFIAENGRLATIKEFWDFWLRLNHESMQRNLAPEYDKEKLSGSCTGLLMHNPPYYSLEEAQKLVLKGAEHRCCKSYCGLLRDFYVMSSLSQGQNGSRGVFEPSTVFWHPVIDVVGKIDTIVLTTKESSGCIGLAIYLKSNVSVEWARNKAEQLPSTLKSNLYSVKCCAVPPPDNLSEDIYVPNDHTITTLRRLLLGYESAEKALSGTYTWTNPKV